MEVIDAEAPGLRQLLADRAHAALTFGDHLPSGEVETVLLERRGRGLFEDVVGHAQMVGSRRNRRVLEARRGFGLLRVLAKPVLAQTQGLALKADSQF